MEWFDGTDIFNKKYPEGSGMEGITNRLVARR
jgi:hypothetical protein